MQTGEATVENSMEFPQKTKNGIVFDPAMKLYTKSPETPIQKNPFIPMFTAVQFTIARCGSHLSAHQQMSGSKTMVHLHNGILHSREKEGAYTLWDSIDGTGEHYVK